MREDEPECFRRAGNPWREGRWVGPGEPSAWDRLLRERFRRVEYADLCDRPQAILEELSAWLEPLGYQRYAQCRVPESFLVSKQRKLPPDLLAKMTERLRVLVGIYQNVASP